MGKPHMLACSMAGAMKNVVLQCGSTVFAVQLLDVHELYMNLPFVATLPDVVVGRGPRSINGTFVCVALPFGTSTQQACPGMSWQGVQRSRNCQLCG